MDPLSLTLAAIPLLVSIAEHYKNVHDIFHRLRKASREAAKLRVDLVVQRSLFHDSCRCLLGQCGLDEPTVLIMLQNSQHETWLTNDLRTKMKATLGSFDQAFVGILQRIEVELKLIEIEVNKCYSSARDRSWRVRLTAKKASLDKSIEMVNRLNANLNDIRMRIVDANRPKQSTSLPVQSRQQAQSISEDRYIQDFTIVRKASHHLHQALASACTEHNQHSTLLNLTPEINTVTECVTFELALRDPQLRSWIIDQTIWLTFESLVTNGLAVSLPVVKELVFVPTNNATRPMASSISGKAPKETDVIPSGNQLHDDRKAFCQDLKTLSSARQPPALIGLFKSTEQTHLKVYRKPAHKLSSLPVTYTLRDLFSHRVSPDRRRFNQYECVQLGRKLTTVVLNFHSTPWLSPSWSGQQVHLIRSRFPTTRPRRYEPYLEVEVTSSRAEPASSLPQANHPAAIENPFLFRLGVLLLELAFEQSLQDMRISEDERDGLPVADFNTAMRIKNDVSAIFGVPYAKIVGQCLKCNFQSGLSDLQESALQEDVHRDVFCKLTSLEEKLESVWC